MIKIVPPNGMVLLAALEVNNNSVCVDSVEACMNARSEVSEHKLPSAAEGRYARKLQDEASAKKYTVRSKVVSEHLLGQEINSAT